MRIMLIYPPLSTFERYSSEIGNAGGRQIPLGVFYVAAYIRQFHHDVFIIDGEAQNKTSLDIAQEAQRYHPDVIGISSTTAAFYRACEAAKDIKSLTPDIPIVLGGAHVSALPELAMKMPCFDFGVIGEGEASFKELLDAIQHKTMPEDIDGIVYRKNDSVKINSFRTPIVNLDSIPFPAYDLIPDFSVYNPPPCNYKKIPAVNIITSRGCPNQCTFCDRSVFGNHLRQRSAENIAEEIGYLYHKHHVREIAFVDDTFTVKAERVFKLFDILNQKNIRFPWTCMSRINTVNYEMLRFMKENGCWHISFGIESGNKEILKRIKKKISLDDARKVVGWCRNLGILSKGFFIVGHPGETLETIEESIKLSLEMPLDDVVVTINTPLPGSEQYENASEYGTLDQSDWTRFNMWTPVFVPKGLTQEILIAKHKGFYSRFYLRPQIMFRYFLSFFSIVGIHRAWALVKTIPFLFNSTVVSSQKK